MQSSYLIQNITRLSRNKEVTLTHKRCVKVEILQITMGPVESLYMDASLRTRISYWNTQDRVRI